MDYFDCSSELRPECEYSPPAKKAYDYKRHKPICMSVQGEKRRRQNSDQNPMLTAASTSQMHSVDSSAFAATSLLPGNNAAGMLLPSLPDLSKLSQQDLAALINMNQMNMQLLQQQVPQQQHVNPMHSVSSSVSVAGGHSASAAYSLPTTSTHAFTDENLQNQALFNALLGTSVGTSTSQQLPFSLPIAQLQRPAQQNAATAAFNPPLDANPFANFSSSQLEQLLSFNAAQQASNTSVSLPVPVLPQDHSTFPLPVVPSSSTSTPLQPLDSFLALHQLLQQQNTALAPVAPPSQIANSIHSQKSVEELMNAGMTMFQSQGGATLTSAASSSAHPVVTPAARKMSSAYSSHPGLPHSSAAYSVPPRAKLSASPLKSPPTFASSHQGSSGSNLALYRPPPPIPAAVQSSKTNEPDIEIIDPLPGTSSSSHVYTTPPQPHTVNSRKRIATQEEEPKKPGVIKDHTKNLLYRTTVQEHQRHLMNRGLVLNTHQSMVMRLRYISEHVIRSLNEFGWAVVDNFLGSEQCRFTNREIERLHERGLFSAGQVMNEQNRSHDHIKDIRSDQIYWFDGSDSRAEDAATIRLLISMIDSLVLHFNSRIPPYTIGGRSRAMLAIYPGNGTRYVKHVDNPVKDGRCITVIYYCNEDWDVKRDGGTLRLYPETSEYPMDVEPKADRIVFFWSDRRNPHEVMPVYRNRFAITIWYMDKEERQKALDRIAHARQQHDSDEATVLSVAGSTAAVSVAEEKEEMMETDRSFAADSALQNTPEGLRIVPKLNSSPVALSAIPSCSTTSASCSSATTSPSMPLTRPLTFSSPSDSSMINNLRNPNLTSGLSNIVQFFKSEGTEVPDSGIEDGGESSAIFGAQNGIGHKRIDIDRASTAAYDIDEAAEVVETSEFGPEYQI